MFKGVVFVRVLLDFGHPKDVNTFKEVINQLIEQGHDVKICSRMKENTRKLLEEYNFDYEMGRYYETIYGKALGVIVNDYILFKIARKFKPDVILTPGSPYAAQVSKILGIPHISFLDTEIATFALKLSVPCTDIIYSSSSFYLDFGAKHKRFNGYLELSYLHPKYFTPDPRILSKYGLNDDYIIVRLSALSSHHDLKAMGFHFNSESELNSFVSTLEKYGRVLIFSEVSEWQVIKEHQIDIDGKDLHDILYHAKLYIGEGATMASESAILGVPSIYVSNTERGYLNELESDYGLVYNISDRDVALQKSVELLSNDSIRTLWEEKRNLMLKDKIDVAKFIVEAVEEFASE